MPRATLVPPNSRHLTRTGVSPSLPDLSRSFRFGLLHRWRPATPDCSGLGSSAFARHYLRNRFSFFSSWYLDVSVPRVVLRGLCPRMAGSSPAGFPHSDTRGSKPRYGSPQLFAVSRVLHRPPVPRHPLHALTSLGGSLRRLLIQLFCVLCSAPSRLRAARSSQIISTASAQQR